MCLVCYALLCVLSRLAIILMRHMLALLYLSSWCLLTGSVLLLFMVVKRVVVRPTGSTCWIGLLGYSVVCAVESLSLLYLLFYILIYMF